MKLDLVRWKESLRSFETTLKNLKTQYRQHREPGVAFDTEPLLLAKAEVTRLYCLRAHLKGRLHAAGQLRRICRTSTQRLYVQVLVVRDLATQEALLRSVEGWMESLLVDASATTQAVPRPTG